MSKKRKQNYLNKAKELADILSYKVTGGAMGVAPKANLQTEDFANMKSLLESMLKIHALELKGGDDDEYLPSAFEILQKESDNGSKKVKSGSSEDSSQFFTAIKRGGKGGGKSDSGADS